MKFKDIVFNFTAKEIYKQWGELYDIKISEVLIEYILAQMKRKRLKAGDGVIRVNLKDGLSTNLYFEGEYYGFSATSWGSILNTEVKLVGATELEAVVVILYELTWYGIDEKTIQKAIEKLKKLIEEDVVETHTEKEMMTLLG